MTDHYIMPTGIGNVLSMLLGVHVLQLLLKKWKIQHGYIEMVSVHE